VTVIDRTDFPQDTRSIDTPNLFQLELWDLEDRVMDYDHSFPCNSFQFQQPPQTLIKGFALAPRRITDHGVKAQIPKREMPIVSFACSFVLRVEIHPNVSKLAFPTADMETITNNLRSIEELLTTFPDPSLPELNLPRFHDSPL